MILTQVDGCLPIEGLAADFVLTKQGAGDIVVELKGRDVEHGVNQVIATMTYWCKNGYRSGRLAGLIVARQYPQSTTSVQRAKERFNKLFRGPLHVLTGDRELKFDSVLGPRPCAP